MIRTILTEIYDKPEMAAIKGAFVSCIFSMINIPQTTEILELIGVAIKDIGIFCGSTVAVASLISYAKKNWRKSNTNNNPN